MGFRFRRTLKIAPGVKLNLSKSGPSLSLGPRGAKYTTGPRGDRATVGIPGTGLSYTSTGHHSKRSTEDAASDDVEVNPTGETEGAAEQSLNSILPATAMLALIVSFLFWRNTVLAWEISGGLILLSAIDAGVRKRNGSDMGPITSLIFYSVILCQVLFSLALIAGFGWCVFKLISWVAKL